MVELATPRTQAPADLSCRHQPGSVVAVVTPCLGTGPPQVLLVGNDRRSIREEDFAARAAEYHLSRPHHDTWKPLLIEDVITGPQLSHRAPAEGRGNRRLDSKRLALQPGGQVVRDADLLQ